MRRLFTIIACMLMIVALLAGCTPAATTGTTAGTTKASETTKAKDPVTLTLFFYSPELTEQYTAMAEQYKTETGNTLDITVLQADFVTVLTAKLNSGDIPDVFMSSAYADNITFKDYYYDMTNEDFIQQMEPSALSGLMLDGKVTGYPFLVQSFSYIYNKKIFADAGITNLPRTISEYRAVCETLTDKGIQPFATGFKEWWVLPQTAWQVLAPVVERYDGDYAQFVAALDAGTVKFADLPEMTAVFDMLDLIKEYGGNKPMESDFNDQCASLAMGKVAMIHQGNWAEDTIRKTNPDIDIGYLLGPVGEDASKAGFMFFSNQTIRVAKDNANTGAALDWLRWLTFSDYGKAWIPSKIKQMSPIKGAAAADAQLAKASTDLLAENAPSFELYYQRFLTGAEQGLGTILQGYCAGQTDRAETIAQLDSFYTKLAKAR